MRKNKAVFLKRCAQCLFKVGLEVRSTLVEHPYESFMQVKKFYVACTCGNLGPADSNVTRAKRGWNLEQKIS